MSDTQTQPKEMKTHLFDVQLNWLSKQKGVISSEDANGTIAVATPETFGGEGKDWSPEHLLLGAVSGCWMTTYLFFSGKFGFDIYQLGCPATGKVEYINGRLGFSRIDVYPLVVITNKQAEEKARIAMEKTGKYCLISNSISTDVFYHPQLNVKPVL